MRIKNDYAYNKILAVRISVDILRRLERFCRKEKINKAEAVRRALELYFESKKGEKKDE